MNSITRLDEILASVPFVFESKNTAPTHYINVRNEDDERPVLRCNNCVGQCRTSSSCMNHLASVTSTPPIDDFDFTFLRTHPSPHTIPVACMDMIDGLYIYFSDPILARISRPIVESVKEMYDSALDGIAVYATEEYRGMVIRVYAWAYGLSLYEYSFVVGVTFEDGVMKCNKCEKSKFASQFYDSICGSCTLEHPCGKHAKAFVDLIKKCPTHLKDPTFVCYSHFFRSIRGKVLLKEDLTTRADADFEAALNCVEPRPNNNYSLIKNQLLNSPRVNQPSPFDRSDSSDYEEQGEETEASTEKVTGKTKANKMDAKAPKPRKTHKKKVKAKNLVDNQTADPTPLAMQDTQTSLGKNCFRNSMSVKTPDGPQDAIIMANSRIEDDITLDFMPHTTLPEWGNVWTKIPFTSTQTVPSPGFNARTRELMKFFSFWRSLYCYKIVAPLPLFNSGRYWISLVLPGFEGNDLMSNVGFDWNPTENPEIYVVVPWQSEQYTLNNDENYPGSIRIEQITPTLYADGYLTSITPNIYGCPIDMRLYNPTPVAISSSELFTLDYGFLSNDQIQLFSNSDIYAALLDEFGTGITALGLAYDEDYLSAISLYEQTPLVARNLFVQKDDPVTLVKKTTTDTLWTPGTGTVRFYSASPITYNSIPITPSYVEEIFEYDYNADFDQNKKDHGELGDHTARADATWYPIKQNIQIGVPFSLKPPDAALSHGALIDYSRHLYFSKFPIVKILQTSLPSCNYKFRIVALPSGSTAELTNDQALQMPGWEFDLKDGDFDFQPYWNQPYPVTAGFGFPYLQVNVIGGYGESSEYQLDALINFAPVEYHHLRSNIIENYVEQIDSEETKDSDPSDPEVVEVTEIIETNYEDDPIRETEMAERSHEQPSQTENRWLFVGSHSFDSTVGAVSFPVDISSMGDWFKLHALRYLYWRGCPTYKIMITNSSNVNGVYNITQTNESIPEIGFDSATIIDNQTFVTTTGRGDPAILRTLWKTYYSKHQIMENATEAGRNLGKVLITNPITTGEEISTTNTFIPAKTYMSVYVDVSNVKLSDSTSGVIGGANAQPPPVVFTNHAR